MCQRHRANLRRIAGGRRGTGRNRRYRREKGREVAESVSNSGTDAISPTTDISDWDNVQRLVQETIGRFGRIDGLMNNVAFYQRPKVMARVPFEQIPLDEWDEMMSVNLRGAFLCCLAVVPLMKLQR